MVFKAPIRYGEQVTVETWVTSNNGIRTVYIYHILNENNELAVSSTTEHVIVPKDTYTFCPLSLRKSFPNWNQAYEKQNKGE